MIKLFKAVKTGTAKINEVIETFTNTIDKLNEAVVQVQDEITINQEIVEKLKARNTVLGSTKVAGLKLISGINDLLGN
jgi:uncharacterized protein YlxW (UPF0749 family)